MHSLLTQFRFTKNYDKAITLQWLHLALCFFALLAELLNDYTNVIYFLLKFFALLLLYRFLFVALKELLYTFWTLLFFVFAHFFYYAIYYASVSQSFFILYSIGCFLIMIEAYIMSSPLFYPRIQWWEYDFRIRSDIKIKVKLTDKEVDGRLTDLRREAGCIVLFEELNIGDKISFSTLFLDEEIFFLTEVVSKREPCPGRGMNYGVKFFLENEEEKKLYNRFSRFWRVKSKGRLRRKFRDNP